MAVITTPCLATVYSRAKRTLINTRSVCASFSTRTAAGPVTIKDIVDDMLSQLVIASNELNNLPAGIVAYAQAQENDDQYDVGAEGAAALSTIEDVQDWIIENLPKDGSGFLLERSLGADGGVTLRTVSSAQTAGLRTQLAAVVSAIAAP